MFAEICPPACLSSHSPCPVIFSVRAHFTPAHTPTLPGLSHVCRGPAFGSQRGGCSAAPRRCAPACCTTAARPCAQRAGPESRILGWLGRGRRGAERAGILKGRSLEAWDVNAQKVRFIGLRFLSANSGMSKQRLTSAGCRPGGFQRKGVGVARIYLLRRASWPKYWPAVRGCPITMPGLPGLSTTFSTSPL